jgi:hypothetical protein
MVARVLMVVSASIVLTLGLIHFVYTFWGQQLTPRDYTLQISMSQISPVVTKETTMWRCWVGFNASHSMGLILFGLVFGFLAVAHSQLLFQSPFPAHCRAGNAWRYCCALQVIFFQCAIRGHERFFGLLYRQHYAIASLTYHSVNDCNRDVCQLMGTVVRQLASYLQCDILWVTSSSDNAS